MSPTHSERSYEGGSPSEGQSVEDSLAAAVADRLNRILEPRGVRARVSLHAGCLNVLLSSIRPLHQQTFVTFIERQLQQSGIEAVQLVKVHTRLVGEDLPAWSQSFVPMLPATQPITQPITQSGTQTAIVVSNQSQPQAPFKESDFLRTLRAFQMAAVFPYRDVLGAQLYNTPIVRLLLFFGLFPLVVDLVSDRANLSQVAWMLGIYYALAWGIVLYDLIKPPHFSWGMTLKCLLFTTFVGIPILLLVQRVPPVRDLYAAIGSGWVQRLIGFVFGVGVLEELCKGTSVYLFVFRSNRRDPLTAAFYGSMSGLGFAIAEGVTYSLVYGMGFSQGNLALGSYMAVNTVRFVSLPLFHALLAGIVGYFIGLAAINRSRQGAILFIGVSIAATLHGLYNSFAGSLVGLLIVGFSILLFVAYLRRSQQMVQEMEKAELAGRKV